MTFTPSSNDFLKWNWENGGQYLQKENGRWRKRGKRKIDICECISRQISYWQRNRRPIQTTLFKANTRPIILLTLKIYFYFEQCLYFFFNEINPRYFLFPVGLEVIESERMGARAVAKSEYCCCCLAMPAWLSLGAELTPVRNFQ